MLFSVVSAFDAAYAAYADFQRGIERYWTLQHGWNRTTSPDADRQW